MKELLIKLDACTDAREWAGDKTWEEIYSTCHRGDWLLWLFKKTNPDDLQLLTLAKGHCANTVRHLMKDERSIKAAYAAYAAADADAAYADAAYAAAYAAADAADGTAFGVDAYVANAYAYAANAAYDARKENQLLTANICRQYLPIDVWNINSN